MIFAYCRVSTLEQNPKNQVLEIEKAGFKVDEVINEYCSGSVYAKQRKAFSIMLEKLRENDVLVVTKLDRLGRNVLDIKQTIDIISEKKVKLHCLALQGVDLTSSSGSLIVSVIGAIAQYEKDLIVERTQSGLQRAKAQGKKLGRPSKLSDKQKKEVNLLLEQQISVRSIAKKFNVSRQVIIRIKQNLK